MNDNTYERVEARKLEWHVIFSFYSSYSGVAMSVASAVTYGMLVRLALNGTPASTPIETPVIGDPKTVVVQKRVHSTFSEYRAIHFPEYLADYKR